MSIGSQIDRINQNITNTYSVLESAGATMPAEANSDNLPGTAQTISAVLYGKEQNLTDEQKAQARANIGVSESGGETVVMDGDVDIFATIGTTFPPAQKPAAADYEGYDIDILHSTADDVYAYIDEVANGKSTVTKEIMGKDASGKYDVARYIYANREHIAWQRANYPKMYAWKNGSTVIYSVSVSPRKGDTMYSTKYVGTAYSTVTAVSATNRSRTVNGLVFTRYEAGDIEPTVIYTRPDDERNNGTSITQDGVTYNRYPLGDLGANRAKLTPIFIYANEHGSNKDLLTDMSPPEGGGHEGLMPALIASRLMRDLASGEQANNPLYQYIRANCMVIIIPVANPFGFNYHLTSDTNKYNAGYYNANGCNINRNYDTPGWDVMNAAGNDAGTMGAYVGSENETQYIMNTMVESGAKVAMSLHGFWGWSSQKCCLIQGQDPDGSDYNQDSYWKVRNFLKENYGYNLYYYERETVSGEIVNKPCLNTPDITSKSPSYITQCGAYGGIVEFNEDDIRSSAVIIERNSFTTENAYAQMLNLMGMWIADAVGVEENVEDDTRITELEDRVTALEENESADDATVKALESRVTTLENGVSIEALVARVIELENRVAVLEENEEVAYTITRNLTHCTINNDAFSVTEGSSYNATITANSGYVLDSVTVTMGGTNITSTAYSNGKITIGSVTGNIVITATAVVEAVPTYTVTNNLTNCSNSNSATSVNEGSAYNATIMANNGYTLGSAVIPGKAAVIVGKRYSLSGGAFKTEASVSAVVLPLPKNITGTVTVTLVNMTRDTNYGNVYGGTVNSAFTKEVHASMAGTDVSKVKMLNTAYSTTMDPVSNFKFVTFFVDSTGAAGQYDSSKILVDGIEIPFEITTDPTIATQESTTTGSVTATMGGSAVAVNNGVINIPSVTGNIVITAKAVEE